MNTAPNRHTTFPAAPAACAEASGDSAASCGAAGGDSLQAAREKRDRVVGIISEAEALRQPGLDGLIGQILNARHAAADVSAALAAIRNADLLTEGKTVPDGESLASLAEAEVDDSQTLLGTEGCRYVCRGGSMLFVGPSGTGKSTASCQQDVQWSLGRSAFGIMPARPLSIVTVQAENDRGDLIRMATGIMKALHLSEADRREVGERTRYVTHCTTTGSAFLGFLRDLLRQHRPDILRIDPLMAYAGADLTKAENIAAFCRNGLNPLTGEYGCGVIVNHHTPKTTGTNSNKQARKDWGAFDWQYSAAGSADLANWCRAMLVIQPLSQHVFAFRAAKRWPGWRDPDGNAEYVRHFSHATEQGEIYWSAADDVSVIEAQASTRAQGRVDLETMRSAAVALVKKPVAPKVFKDQLRQRLNLSKNDSEVLLSMLIAEDGELRRWTVGTWPQTYLVGTPAQHAAWKNPELPSVLLPAAVLSSCPLKGGRKTVQGLSSCQEDKEDKEDRRATA